MHGAAVLVLLLAAGSAAAQAPASPQPPSPPPKQPAKTQWQASTESLNDFLSGGMQLFRIEESETGGVTERSYWLTGPYRGAPPGLVRCHESFSLSRSDKGAEPVVTPLSLSCRVLVRPYNAS